MTAEVYGGAPRKKQDRGESGAINNQEGLRAPKNEHEIGESTKKEQDQRDFCFCVEHPRSSRTAEVSCGAPMKKQDRREQSNQQSTGPESTKEGAVTQITP
jgi:hypothetical protein